MLVATSNILPVASNANVGTPFVSLVPSPLLAVANDVATTFSTALRPIHSLSTFDVASLTMLMAIGPRQMELIPVALTTYTPTTVTSRLAASLTLPFRLIAYSPAMNLRLPRLMPRPRLSPIMKVLMEMSFRSSRPRTIGSDRPSVPYLTSSRPNESRSVRRSWSTWRPWSRSIRTWRRPSSSVATWLLWPSAASSLRLWLWPSASLASWSCRRPAGIPKNPRLVGLAVERAEQSP